MLQCLRISKSKSVILLKNRRKYMKILKINTKILNNFEVITMRRVMNRKHFQFKSYQVYFLKYFVIKNFRILLELQKILTAPKIAATCTYVFCIW